MSVTSLTGTTWIINSSPAYSPFTYSSPIKQTNIFADFESDGTQYTSISIIDLNALMIYYVAESTVSAYSSSSGWSSENKRTITFLGEPYNGGHTYDATAEQVIEWLEANAVQILPDVSVSLGTSSIASLNDTGFVTLATQNTYLTDDITVEYTKPSAPTPTLQSKSVTYSPSISQQTDTVTADSGYDGLSSVNVTVDAVSRGTAGTPTATKGTVSNNSVSITPKVTNVGGMIAGGTINGTAVTVSASELVSGTLSITSNGTYNVANFSSAEVNVSGGGEDTVVPFIQNRGTMTSFAHSSIAQIGIGAFAYCPKLTTVSFPSCLTVGSSAFTNCSSLTTVSFPACTTISSCAFYTCSYLTEASFPACTFIGYAAFSYCYRMTTVSFPACTGIGSNAFANCSKLTVVNFPSCTSIYPSAFYNCISITTAEFQSCVTVGSNAFSKCSSLTTVSFPACKVIGGNAFAYCSKLTTASFPSCTSIAVSAFYRCFNLISLYLLGSSIPSLANSNAFTSTPIAGYTTSTGGVYGSIYVPSSLYSSYKTATNWTYFSSRFVSV